MKKCLVTHMYTVPILTHLTFVKIRNMKYSETNKNICMKNTTRIFLYLKILFPAS